jgi:hypothetical protein
MARPPINLSRGSYLHCRKWPCQLFGKSMSKVPLEARVRCPERWRGVSKVNLLVGRWTRTWTNGILTPRWLLCPFHHFNYDTLFLLKSEPILVPKWIPIKWSQTYLSPTF